MATSSEQELISRLIAKIAELEEKLYKKELDAPLVGKLAAGSIQVRTPRTDDNIGSAKEGGFFSSLKEGFRQLELSYETGFAPSTSGVAAGPPLTATPAAVLPASAAEQPEPVASAALPPASEWFSGLFKKDKQPGGGAGNRMGFLSFSEKENGAANGLSPFRGSGGVGASTSGRGAAAHAGVAEGDSYYRYVFDPVDVEAEMEVTGRVRRAAAEALMEAEAKLQAAEEAGRRMQEQLNEAKNLGEEVERLKAENLRTLATRKEIEDEVIATRSQLEGMHGASESLQEELEGMRRQAEIWQSSTGDEREKLKLENKLLRSQMQTRLNELTNAKSKLTDAEAERQRLNRDLEDQASKLQWLTKINSQLENSAAQLEHFRKQAAEFQEMFMKERNVRRKLHEQLQVLRGNIRVMCRVRPVQPGERDIIGYPLEGLLSVSPQDKRMQEFEFDHVFGPEAQQEAIFNEVSSLVRSCADGFNVCIFAYGQTGSGKTHTMEGQPDNPGINVRVLQELFSIAAEEGVQDGWAVQVSVVEIYNDAVHDLLRPSSEVDKPLEVSGLGPGELPSGMDRIPGVTWRSLGNVGDVKQVLRDGSKNRSTASTALNAHSSRSHALVSIKVAFPSADGRQCTSTIHLVDLAGSERVDKSEVTGQQLKEAQSINKSLSALGDVINALQRKGAHIPFRNSKLTQVLQDSLCGTSKVLLVCNVAPEACSASETISSLNFASRAAQVELGQTRRANERVADRTSASGSADRPPSAATTPVAKAVSSVNNSSSSGTIRQSRSSQNVSKLQ